MTACAGASRAYITLLLLGTAALALAACGHPSAATCKDDLQGVYTTPAGERWHLLDNGPTLEAYPMFDDAHGSAAVAAGSADLVTGSADLVLAPRVIDLMRTPAGLEGSISRRFMRRADACTGRAPFHVTACTADGLEVVAGDVAPPLALAPCTPAPPLPSRAEHWRRD